MNITLVPYGNAKVSMQVPFILLKLTRQHYFQVENQCVLSEWREMSNAPPVNFTLYIEALCPDCKDFIKSQLWPVWKKVKSILNLAIIPYGNAIVSTTE